MAVVRFPSRIAFRAPEDLLDAIDVAADRQMKSPAEWMRQALLKALETQGISLQHRSDTGASQPEAPRSIPPPHVVVHPRSEHRPSPRLESNQEHSSQPTEPPPISPQYARDEIPSDPPENPKVALRAEPPSAAITIRAMPELGRHAVFVNGALAGYRKTQADAEAFAGRLAEESEPSP